MLPSASLAKGSPEYSFAWKDRSGTTRRRVSVSRAGLVAGAASLLSAAVLAGLLVGGAEEARLAGLLAENEALKLENDSYLQATRELTDQITNLQSAITELSTLAELDPATRRAIDRLPAIVRARAMGGSATVPAARSTAPGAVRPSAILAPTSTSRRPWRRR